MWSATSWGYVRLDGASAPQPSPELWLVDRVKTCAAHNNLEMPPPSRTSKTPARIRSTTQPEAVVPDFGEAQWRRQFIEAVDIVEAELS